MDRTYMARYSLIASAFVLGGLLLVAVYLRGGLDRTARGELVVSKDNITVMAAQTSDDEEALFVLDNVNESLLIYTTELRGNQGRAELVERIDLTRLFRRR